MKAKKNGGYSLVEVMVVVAILAVAIGVGGYSINLILSARAKQAAETIRTTIENTRLQAMAHGTASVEIYENSEGEIWVKQLVNGAVTADQKAGSSSIVVKYHTVSPSASVEIDGTNSLTLSFKGSTGAFESLVCDTISIEGQGKDYVITCYALTGRVTME